MHPVVYILLAPSVISCVLGEMLVKRCRENTTCDIHAEITRQSEIPATLNTPICSRSMLHCSGSKSRWGYYLEILNIIFQLSLSLSLLQMIIWRIQPLAKDHPRNRPLTIDHPEDPASCKLSSGGSCHLQMIIPRMPPLENYHSEDPATC